MKKSTDPSINVFKDYITFLKNNNEIDKDEAQKILETGPKKNT
ncbi:MAG: hypothetical protein PWP45_1295 [Tepidanaerobacteraceae bacterium]|nr:hypothetical protein [Tepidanaerobacteraceae bacterium]